MYKDNRIHGKSCAQWASSEETTQHMYSHAMSVHVYAVVWN